MRRRRIQHSPHARSVDAPPHYPDCVVTIDPRHPLTPVSEGAPNKESKRKGNFLQCPTIRTENCAESQDHDSGPILGLPSCGLPSLAHVRGEIRAGPGVLFKDLVTA